MSAILQDARYGLRNLAKSPGFFAIAALTLAFGIGGSTALFTVVNAVLLRPLPFKDPSQLVRITADMPGLGQTDVGLSYPEMLDYRDRLGIFQQVSGIYPVDSNLTEVDRPVRVNAPLVSGSYFQILGVQAQLGRLFTPEEETAGIAPLSVISDGLWRRQFGADPNVIGRKIKVDEDLYEIIGVAPPNFSPPGHDRETGSDMWSPSGYHAAPFGPPRRREYFMSGALARLKPGISMREAQSRLDRFAEQLRKEYPADYPANIRWAPRIVDLQDDVVGSVRPALLVLLAAVGCVLLIGCVNVANLLLARAAGRRKELALRVALGAGRGRLVQQMLAESLILSLTGGAIALLIMHWLVALLLRFAPSGMPRLGEIQVSAAVWIFGLGISTAAGVLFGLFPAVQASGVDPNEALKEGSRSFGGSRGTRQMRSLLVVSEFALALILLVGAGLLIRSFHQVLAADFGFDAHNVLVARIWLPQPNDPKSGPYFTQAQRAILIQNLTQKLEVLPSVQQATVSVRFPLGDASGGGRFVLEDRPRNPSEVVNARLLDVGPAFLDTLRIPLIAGRKFDANDDSRGARVAMVDESFARSYWPGQSPIGKRLQFYSGPEAHPAADSWISVVGVVRDVATDSVGIENRPHIYLSILQSSNLALTVLVRAQSHPELLAEAIRREVQSIDPNLPVYGVKTMEEMVSEALAQRRFAMLLLGLFAALALLLASLGIYGVVSHAVTQRTAEFGVRMALGAQKQDILRSVLIYGGGLSLVGIGVGMAGAFFLSRVLRSLLYRTSVTDPSTFLSVSLLLMAVALLACFLPAWRATRVDPLVALRYQ